MAIELANDEEMDSCDDQLNSHGIMDFGYWVPGEGERKPYFVPICKECRSLKMPACSAVDLYCLDCNYDDPFHLRDT